MKTFYLSTRGDRPGWWVEAQTCFLWIAGVLPSYLNSPFSYVCLHVFRFLYSDEVQIGPETVMTTLYTAKKYAVPALEAHCVEFLKKNLRADNAFMLLTQVSLWSSAFRKVQHSKKMGIFWVLESWSSKVEQFWVVLNSSSQESSTAWAGSYKEQ